MVKAHTNNYNYVIQMIRGLCILGVIFIHCPSAIEYDAVSNIIWITWRQVIVFPVAIFLFIAGNLFDSKKYKDYMQLLTVRGGRLIVPFLFWSVVYLSIDILRSVINGRPVDYWNLFIRLITGRAIGPFYYIIVLFLLTCISPLLESIVYKRNKKSSYALLDVLLLMITPVYAAIIYWMMITKGSAFSYYAMLLPAWILFYYIGIRTSILCCNPNKRIYVIILFVGLTVSFIEAFFYLKNGLDIEFVIGQLKASSICYTIAVAILFYSVWTERKDYKPKRIVEKVLIWYGDHSYIIYLSHCIVLLLANAVLSRFHLNWIINYTVTFIIVVVISFLAISIVEKISKGTRIERMLKNIGF